MLNIDDVRRRVRQGRKLALAKACGVRPALRVLDGMAGFGLDGITLATLGCDVLMVEREPAVCAARDALARARVGTDSCRATWNAATATSATCSTADARSTAIYLDPMFPARDKHALPRRSAQLLSDLLGAPDDDLPRLIARARCGRASARRREAAPTRCNAGRARLADSRSQRAVRRLQRFGCGRAVLEPRFALRLRAQHCQRNSAVSTTLDARVTSPITSA